MIFVSPQWWRLGSRRWRWGVRLHGCEHLADESGRSPRDKADRATRAADAHKFVRGRLVVRREHNAQAGQDSVEGAVAVRQGLRVCGFPGQLDTDLRGPLLADLHQFRREI